MGNPIKPVNLGTKGCNPTSSSCVYWQGEDIDCIEICEGATINDVIHAIGCLTCQLKDQLDVDTYEIDCLIENQCEAPHTFREMQQFIIEMLCQLKENQTLGVSGSSTSTTTYTVAQCFQNLGANQTLDDYLQNIANLVCQQQSIINNQQAAIESLLARVDSLEKG